MLVLVVNNIACTGTCNFIIFLKVLIQEIALQQTINLPPLLG